MDQRKADEDWKSQAGPPPEQHDFVEPAPAPDPSADHVDLTSDGAQPQPADPTPPPPAVESAAKGVKETVESILIAFILAFVFRAFVVEAFVIPTGSMAPTLAGAHMRWTCKECGYTFDVGWDERQQPGDETPPFAGPDKTGRNKVYSPNCQNCKFPVDPAEATNPPIRYGDRILVLKYVYIPWISSPRRWDVVVFKTPHSDTGEPPFTTNYIKRLVGLPGEHVMLLDGDIYTRSADDAKKGKELGDPGHRWQIQPKPRYAQDAMWRLVFDNDYRPLHNEREADRWHYPWLPDGGAGWDLGDRTASKDMAFDNLTGAGGLKFDFKADRSGRYGTDWLSYNDPYGQYHGHHAVSDFRLRFFYDRRAGDGPLKARLTKHGHEFELELTRDAARLTHRAPRRADVSIPPAQPFKPADTGGPVQVEFSVADYQVIVRLNDRVIFQTTPDQYAPDVADLLRRYGPQSTEPEHDRARVSISADRQKATLSHVSLWRDVYYTPPDRHGVPPRGIELGAGEYFVMGDNSAKSSDARAWTKKVDLPDEDLKVEDGRVPERFMLGRAFFVYWPAGYKPFKGSPSVVPNFGEMRMIR
ncbi:MAG TPA: S26 family signal peptidase [Tepidisphaeraceae bacterium]|nr:S26 family signal peptidase [Tepidisphaeraceae bacterium]